MAREINLIVVHCADTPDGRPQTVADIDAWHRARGFHRSPRFKTAFNPSLTSIGYHYVIYVDGTVHTGRHPDEVGAHAVGHNHDSLGICLLGQSRYTAAQWDALRNLVNDLLIEHGGKQTTVCGHRDLPNVHKECPGFDVDTWRAAGMVAEAAHLLTA
ncbi:N-acetylmuramoyl-L-alanine amidase [Geobacter sp.]|uniref:N-acetylmuramoyl-L-alanine amidase n=1 Tax=Geobacter sp. TaxID=46610 RepID=UPI002616B601|nr:N-acetylmuramoyl-L-alanine amidase [Geobacter sp.]